MSLSYRLKKYLPEFSSAPDEEDFLNYISSFLRWRDLISYSVFTLLLMLSMFETRYLVNADKMGFLIFCLEVAILLLCVPGFFLNYLRQSGSNKTLRLINSVTMALILMLITSLAWFAAESVFEVALFFCFFYIMLNFSLNISFAYLVVLALVSFLLQGASMVYGNFQITGLSEFFLICWFVPGGMLFLMCGFNHNLHRAHRQEYVSRKQLKDQRRALAELASTDALTGLLNRRSLLKGLEIELARAKRHQQELTVVMIDLDLFKGINDRYGHAVGDLVLVHFSDLLNSVLRTEDVAARYGGEEFLIVFPQTGLGGAQKILQRLRQKLAMNPVKEGGVVVQYTFSGGIASSDQVETAEQIIRVADEALYQAKEQGRDQWQVAVS